MRTERHPAKELIDLSRYIYLGRNNEVRLTASSYYKYEFQSFFFFLNKLKEFKVPF